MEEELKQLRQEITTVQGCTSDFCTIHWTSWSTWGAWTHCTGQCNQGYASREQSRTRTRRCVHQDLGSVHQFCNGSSTEVDKRPCNAVEFYGCLNEQNTNTSDGTYALAYNFFDELAQSTCTAVLNTPAHVAAIRRNCYSGHAPECSTLCQNLGYSCFEELYVYRPSATLHPNQQKDEGKQGLAMYRYFSCSWGSGTCGPNYCCCRYA